MTRHERNVGHMMASLGESAPLEFTFSERTEVLRLLEVLEAAMRCPAHTRVPFPLSQAEMLRRGARALGQLADLMDGPTPPEARK